MKNYSNKHIFTSQTTQSVKCTWFNFNHKPAKSPVENSEICCPHLLQTNKQVLLSWGSTHWITLMFVCHLRQAWPKQLPQCLSSQTSTMPPQVEWMHPQEVPLCPRRHWALPMQHCWCSDDGHTGCSSLCSQGLPDELPLFAIWQHWWCAGRHGTGPELSEGAATEVSFLALWLKN